MNDELSVVTRLTSHRFAHLQHEPECFLQCLICCKASRVAQFICGRSFALVIPITIAFDEYRVPSKFSIASFEVKAGIRIA